MNELKKTMYEGVIHQYEKIDKDMEVGTEEHSRAINDANSMADRVIKLHEVGTEEKKLAAEERDKMIKHAITIGTFVAALTLQGIFNVLSMRFEQGYSHTTQVGKKTTNTLLSLVDKVKV